MSKILLFFVFSICMYACQNGNVKKDADTTANESKVAVNGISGTWTLIKELHENGKDITWEGRPTVPEMTFKENGYFLFVDRITDEKMKSEGIPAIQDRYKGQYEIKGKELKMNHYDGDSLIVRHFNVETLSAEKLIINDKEHGHTMIFKR